MKRNLLIGGLLLNVVGAGWAQPTETVRFAIEVAGARVGTMTATRQTNGDQTLMTLTSDVKVNLLVYKVIVYYKVVNRFRAGKLLLSTVDARTNRGTFASRTEWTGDRYVISASQYKYNRQTTQTEPIDFAITNLYFTEPVGRNRVYSEYFGDYFQFTRTPKGAYRAQLNDREDEYVYQNGRLERVIKKNAIKNYIIRREE